LEPQTITESRLKASGSLAVSLVFFVIGLVWLRHPDGLEELVMAWLCVVLFGFGVLVMTLLMVRPMVLRLDADGYTLSGGLMRAPRQTLWRNIEPFYIYQLPRGGRMIGYNYVAGYKPDNLVKKFNRAFGAEAALPRGWPSSPEKMVTLLNDYRARALGTGSGARFTEQMSQPDPIVR
jgi:hypothetical protein